MCRTAAFFVLARQRRLDPLRISLRNLAEREGSEMTQKHDLQTRILLAMTVEKVFDVWTPSQVVYALFRDYNGSNSPEYRRVVKALHDLYNDGKVGSSYIHESNQSVYWAKHYICP